MLELEIDTIILTMLNPDIFCFKNRVDADQLASEKPADQHHTVFQYAHKYILKTGILHVIFKLGRSVVI